MNFVKGFLRRGSGSQDGVSSPAGRPSRSSSDSQAWPDVQFSNDVPEVYLKRLWEQYESATSKIERQKTLEAFLLKFNGHFERWVPKDQRNEGSRAVISSCVFGHPTQVVAGLVQELKRTSDFTAQLNASADDPFLNTSDMEAALCLLSALAIITRSDHNRTVFSFFGGLQLLTGLMKNAVVHVKTVSGVVTAETAPGSPVLMLLSFLQCLLAHIVSITASFLASKRPSSAEKDLESATRSRRRSSTGSNHESTVFAPLLETGGLNWFVELLRVLRKLRLKGVFVDRSLETLTLQTLKTAIAANPRAQNHFKSIGGLEVLLDGLGSLPAPTYTDPRSSGQILEAFKLQMLSLEVTREAVFRNINCLQFLREYGGISQFIQLFRWAALSLPEYQGADDDRLHPDSKITETRKLNNAMFLGLDGEKGDSQGSSSYISHLCRVFCSFLVASGDLSSLAGPSSQDATGVTGVYWESATRLVLNVLLGVFKDENNDGMRARLMSGTLQRSVLDIFKKMLAISPSVLQLFREEGVWTILFSEFFFYSGLENNEARDTEPLQLEVISFVELAATVNANANNLLECSTLVQALEQCIRLPNTVTMILKSLHRILQLAPEATSSSFKELDFVVVLSEVMSWQLQALDKEGDGNELLQARDAAFLLFNEYLILSEDAKFVVLRSVKIMDVLFTLICDSRSRVFAIQHISNFMKLAPNTEEDQDAKMELCMKYMETLSRIQSEYRSAGIDIICDLLAILRDVLESDLSYYQALLREVECFVHVVSLLNEVHPQDSGRRLCLDVMSTLICLLKGNESSKLAIRSLVGPGYRMLQTLLIDQHQGIPDQAVLQSVLDMLVDGKFEESSRMVIQNEDAIILLFNVIRQCDEATQLKALDTFLSLLENSSANQASCVRAGALCILLDWFSDAREGVLIEKLSQLMQLVGGHSMSGKEMRKIFSLLRGTMDSSKAKNGLLLNNLKTMLKEQGPSVFFEHNGKNSGISITTPLRWPSNKGYTFMSWIRLEVFASEGLMGLFSFSTEDGRGCTTLISANKIVVESAGQKRQALTANISLMLKRWHFICITHSTGRALSTGSALKIYVDGVLVASEKFRYPKVYDPLTRCTIGAGASYPVTEDNLEGMPKYGSASPLCGQLGPLYLFDDVFPEDLVEGVYKLGPAYMYSFLPNEAGCLPSGTPANSTLFSSKEGIASKMIIGYNAQASSGRSLFNIAPECSENEATIMAGTRLCYRRLVQDNIHCVGGITVFFPLLTHHQQPTTQATSARPDDSYVLDVLELLSAFLDRNFANQKLLDNCGGLSLLGFLLQFVSFKQLSVKVVSALNTLLGILAQASDAILAESLVNECILKIYLNPSAWIFTPYVVQRELYLSLLNFLENHASFNKFCSLPDFLDMLHQFYWDKPKMRRSSKSTSSLAGERPRQEEVSQLRILILSLAEGVLRSNVTMKDAKALVAYVGKTDDLVCLEDILQMLLGLLAEGDFSAKFLDLLHGFGGVHIFLSLLKRQEEVIRLLTLQILGTLFCRTAQTGKKPSRLFGGSKTSSDQQRDTTIWCLISERLVLFPFTPQLRITLFDLLLGGPVARTLLQGGLLAQFGRKSAERSFISRLSVIDPTHSGSVSQIVLCRVFGIILKCMLVLEDSFSRQSILKDLLAIVDASPSNCELILQEQTWQDWLFSVLATIFARKRQDPSIGREEEILMRKLLCALHSHAVCSIRGGWRHIERSVAYLQIYAEKVSLSADSFLCDLLADLLEDVLNGRPPQEALSMQPCRDNVLFVLSLVDELAARDAFQRLPFTSISALDERPESTLLSGGYVDLGRDDTAEDAASSEERRQSSYYAASTGFDRRLYDYVWTLICTINGKGQDGGPSGLPGTSTGPSFGQRARGLVESLNIPAAEVAAAVTGGLGSVGINISTKSMEKALKLRGEKFLRLAFRMVLLYLYKADLEAAMSSVRHLLSVLPALLSGENEQSRSQLHLLLWSLLDARTHVGSMDDGARYHVLSQLIQEVLQVSKNILATSIVDKDKRMAETTANDSSSAYNLLQQEKVLAAVKDERKFLRGCRQQWLAEVGALRAELREALEGELQDAKLLEEQYQSVSNALYHYESNRRQAYQLKHDEHEQAISNLWRLTLRNLTDERGPWSSMQFQHSSPLNWKLDKTEDPVRRRLKLKRNYHFDEKLVLAPTSLERSASEDGAMSSSTKMHARKLSNNFKALFEKEVNEDEMQDAKEDFDKETESKESSSTEDDATEAKNSSEDEVLASVCCVLVSSKRKLAGRLEVFQGSLHFHLDHVVEGTGGSMVFDAAGTGFNVEDISWRREGEFKDSNIKQHRRWDSSQITAIYGTRYLLQYTALEIFFANSTPPMFFNFATQQIAKDLALKIISCRNGTSRSKDKSQIHYVDRKKALELAERARDSWRRRECSNFEYLMILNTLAGRSHNDLTQYPVLPWVLSDYTSNVLDLSNPSVYRDFSRPVGALDEKRFKVFEERYNNFSDPDIPSFYYGSHYSSMGIVLFYLLRVEPFTSLHRNLQGGKFDHADRLFHSIEAAYSNCLTNTSDVKELIPEFFYMPELLTNMNKYFIGVKQDGMQIDDVVLPPWAKASPEEFIRLHREALESEYVSDHLHLWIDLIFGYKQRGKPAVEAANVFYYLTYEGAVELDTLNDLRQRASVEDQIANFGQTPAQLFRKKHPRRGPVAPILRPFYYSPGSITLTSSISSRHLSSGSGSDRDPSVVFLAYNDGKVVSVTSDMVASARLWLTPFVQGGGSFTFSSSQDFVFGLGQDVCSPHKLGGHYAEALELVPGSFAALQVQPSMYLLTSGHWDNSFKVVSLSEGRMVQSICLHKDVVTCISVSADGTTVATGSRDTTVMVWEVQLSSRRRSGGAGSSNSSSSLVVCDKPRHVLCGHDDVVSCVVVRTELDLVVSGSRDGTCILYTLRQGRYVRSVAHPSRYTISSLAVSQHGFLVLFSNEDLTMRSCSVNGKSLAEVELNGRLSSMQLSSCGEYLVCGGEQGVVSVRKVYSLELVHRYETAGYQIASLCVTPEDCFIVGTREGKVFIFAVEGSPRRSSFKSRT